MLIDCPSSFTNSRPNLEEGEVTPEIKEELRKRLRNLEDELNRYLAKEYGVDPDKKIKYEKWLISHKPFHWFIEFYGIIKNGGFDAIVGNPPYVEYSKVRSEYSIQKYQTEDRRQYLCLYNSERSLNIVSSERIDKLNSAIESYINRKNEYFTVIAIA